MLIIEWFTLQPRAGGLLMEEVTNIFGQVYLYWFRALRWSIEIIQGRAAYQNLITKVSIKYKDNKIS